MAEEKEEESLELTEDTQEQTDDASSSNEAEQNDAEQIPAIEENQDFAKKKKPNIVKLALFGVIGLLSTILLIGIILYFVGFFDSEDMTEENAKEAKQEKKQIKKEEPKFSLKDINTKVLNKELAKLTNKTIKEEQEAQRIKELEEEKERLENEKKVHKEKLQKEEEKLANLKDELEKKKKKLEEERLRLNELKQEALQARDRLLKEKQEPSEEEVLNAINEANMKKVSSQEDKKVAMKEPKENINEDSNEFLILINVAKINGELYKDYLDKVLEISSDVKLCRDDNNNIEIYFGPFKDNSSRAMIFEKLQNGDFENSYELEMMKDEFNKRCNY